MYQNQIFISKIDRWQQRVLTLGFYEGKLAENEHKIGNFQNSPHSNIHMKQVSHPPFLGIVDDKK